MANKEAGIVGLAHIGVFVSDIKNIPTYENSIDTDYGTIRVAFVGLNGLTIELRQVACGWKKSGWACRPYRLFEEVVERLKDKGIEFNEDIYVAKHLGWPAPNGFYSAVRTTMTLSYRKFYE